MISPFNTVSWSLPQGINDDERADLFTVSLNFTNGPIAQELALIGDADRADLSVVPGMGYIVAVTADSQDGSTVSDVMEFTTPPGGTSQSLYNLLPEDLGELNLENWPSYRC